MPQRRGGEGPVHGKKRKVKKGEGVAHTPCKMLCDEERKKLERQSSNFLVSGHSGRFLFKWESRVYTGKQIWPQLRMHGMGPVRDFENLAPAAHARDGPRPRLRTKARRGEGVAHPLPAMNPRMRNNRVFVFLARNRRRMLRVLVCLRDGEGRAPSMGKIEKLKGGGSRPHSLQNVVRRGTQKT